MAEKKKAGLGKGLTSIFGADVEQFLDDIQNIGGDAPGRREVEIPIAEIRANPYQPRKEFDEKSLRELADSIGVHGIFTPLLVRRSVQGYELIAGERRLRAAKLAGLARVPAISVDFTDEEMMEISILENVQREIICKRRVVVRDRVRLDILGLIRPKCFESVHIYGTSQ